MEWYEGGLESYYGTFAPGKCVPSPSAINMGNIFWGEEQK